MSRYIDADSLRANINTAFWAEIDKIIESAPSIDIVRCKDCRNLYIDTSDEGTSCYWCGVWANATDENSFCSYGKRKDEPQTETSTNSEKIQLTVEPQTERSKHE